MKIKHPVKLLSLILSIITMLSLLACNAEEVTTGEINVPETESSDTIVIETTASNDTDDTLESDSSEINSDYIQTNETESEGSGMTDTQTEESQSTTEETNATPLETTVPEETEPETDPIVELGGYQNSEMIENAGAVWKDDAFASNENAIDEASAITKDAAEMLAILSNKDMMKAGEVYKVKDPLILTMDTSYYGNMAAVIAEGGIIIRDVSNIVLKDIIIKGSITVENSTNITLCNVDIRSDSNAVSVNETSSYIAIESSIVIAKKGMGILSSGQGVSIYETLINADKGVISSGTDLTVQNCKINASATGISSSGKYAVIRNNTVAADVNGVGIEFTKGSYNGLVAHNVIRDVKRSVTVNEGYNCVVLLNSAIYIGGFNTTNLYVVENKLGGLIELKDNNYLLADGNFAVGATVSCRNSKFNGDDLHDVNVREEHGANEELLPHTNKDLFLTMERRDNVTDLSFSKATAYVKYISSMAAKNSVVIVPPGAYNAQESLVLAQAHNDTCVYAFGVYHEKPVKKNADGALSSSVMASLGNLINISGSSITINGPTFGYSYQSSGQAYVLEKWSKGNSNYLRIISSAGYYNGFADSNKSLFATGISAMKGDKSYPWINNLAHTFVSQDDDGTIVLQITDTKQVYNRIEPGDILGCRLAGGNSNTISLSGADILLKDCVMYGYSAALGVYVSGANAKNIQLERFHNTTHSAPIIDKETYDRYKNLENRYYSYDDADPSETSKNGLDIYIDENGNYRGGIPRYGSVDGTHISGAAQGVSATSAIFENMVDDSSNQRSSSSRIAGVVDNKNGTSTVYYKGSVVHTYFVNDTYGSALKSGTPTKTRDFRRGDMMFAYASNGRTLIDGKVYSNAENAGKLPNECHMVHTDANKDCICDYDVCKKTMHYDHTDASGDISPDCRCDICGSQVHTDLDPYAVKDGIGDGRCNSCNVLLTDSDGDGRNDSDKAFMIMDMAVKTEYNEATSELSYSMLAWNNNKRYVITYKTEIHKVTVLTRDINFNAMNGYDVTDNDLFMDQKIICDNVSLNSSGFTFDNVLMQNYFARGILMKTTDAIIKNCTIRNTGNAGVMMLVETNWGESTVARNITIEGCLFDNVGCGSGLASTLISNPIAINGLGVPSIDLGPVAEDNLPCKNIKIIGNKFINTNQYYIITVQAAKDVVISNNIFEGMTSEDSESGERVENTRLSKAIFIDGCINVTLSDNEYFKFGDKSLDQLIVGWNYKALNGSDVENSLDKDGNRIIPEDKDALRP